MNDAVQASLTQQREAMTKMSSGLAGRPMAGLVDSVVPKVKGVHKIGCKEDGENAYRCDLELEFDPAGGKPGKRPASMRFVKTSQGWQLTG